MYKGRQFRYRTNCTHSTAEAIDAMTEAEVPITWNTFLRHCPIEEIRYIFNWYDYHGEGGLHLKDDWCASFHKSTYRGTPCYYIEHSGIEYIWTQELV